MFVFEIQKQTNMNFKVLWTLAMKYSLMVNEFQLSIVPQQELQKQIADHNNTKDLLRTISYRDTFVQITTCQIVVSIMILLCEQNEEMALTKVEFKTSRNFCKLQQKVTDEALNDSSDRIFLIILIAIHCFQLIFFQWCIRNRFQKVSNWCAALLFMIIVVPFSIGVIIHMDK